MRVRREGGNVRNTVRHEENKNMAGARCGLFGLQARTQSKGPQSATSFACAAPGAPFTSLALPGLSLFASPMAETKDEEANFTSALAETPAEEDISALGPAPPKAPSLMEMLDSMSSAAKTTSDKVQDKSAEIAKGLERNRRRSRELEQAVFGMHLTDVDALRKIFDELDTDKSGER